MPSFNYRQPILSPLALDSLLGERYFVVANTWLVNISDADYYPNGTLYIYKGFVTDGASVPMPLILGLLSLGLLRSVGVLFEAAIIHDYVIKHQGLWYVDSFHGFSRSQADRLFRDMVSVYSKPLAYILWVALRLYGVVLGHDW